MESIRPHHRLTAALLALLMLFSLAPTALATSPAEAPVAEESLVQTEGLPEAAEAVSTEQEAPAEEPEATEPEVPAEEPEATEPEAPAEEPEAVEPEAPAEEPEATEPEAPAEEPEATEPEAPAEESEAVEPEAPVEEPETTEPEEPEVVEEQTVKYAPGVLTAYDAQDFTATAKRETSPGKYEETSQIAQGDTVRIYVDLANSISDFGGYLLNLEYDSNLFEYGGDHKSVETFSAIVEEEYYNSNASSGHVMAEGTKAFRIVCIAALLNEAGGSVSLVNKPLAKGNVFWVDFKAKNDAVLSSGAFSVVVEQFVNRAAQETDATSKYIGMGVGTTVQVVVGAPEMTFTSSSDNHWTGTLSWARPTGFTPDSSANYYQLERRVDGGGYEVIGEKLSSEGYVDSDMLPGQTYDYRLTVFVNDEASYKQSYTLDCETPANAKVDGLAATVQNSTKIKLAWSDAEAAHVEGYIVEREADSGGFVRLATVDASSSSGGYVYTDNSAYRGVSFTYRVTPYTETASGTEVGHESATVSAAIPYPDVPELEKTVASYAANQVQIALQWIPVEVTGYSISYSVYRKGPSDTAWQQVQGNLTSTSWTDDTGDLLPETAYSYSVQACLDLNGEKILGRFDDVGKAAKYSLQTPTAGEVTLLSGNRVRLSWTAPELADGYVIYRTVQGAPHNPASETALATLGKDALTYTDNSLTKGNSYTYYIYSSYEGKLSGEAASSGVVVPYPDAVKVVYASSAQAGQITIGWNKVADEADARGSVYYEVYRIAKADYESGRNNWDFVESGGSAEFNTVVEGADYSYTNNDAALKPGKAFLYRVQAFFVVNGTNAEIVGRVGDYKEASVALPNAPQEVRAELKAQDGKPVVTVRWKQVEHADGYAVLRSDGKATIQVATVGAGSLPDDGGTFTVSDAKVQPGIGYTYSVSAYSIVDGQRVWGDAAQAELNAFALPTVESFYADSNGKAILLTWFSSDGGHYYTLERQDVQGGEWKPLVTLADNDTNTQKTDKDVLPGESYRYRLTPYTTDYIAGKPAECIGVAPSAAAPDQVKVRLVSDGHVQITWSAPQEGAPAWYGVYRTEVTLSSGQAGDAIDTIHENTRRQIASIPATAEKGEGFKYTDVNAVKGTAYLYKVESFDTKGGSVFSGESAEAPIRLPKLDFVPGFAGLTVKSSDGAVGTNVITWSSSAACVVVNDMDNDTSVEGYELFRTVNGQLNYDSIAYVPDSELVDDHYEVVDSTAVAGTKYVYGLKARTTVNSSYPYYSDYKLSSVVTTAVTTASNGAVLKNWSIVSSNKVRIEWEPVEGAAQYAVWRTKLPTPGDPLENVKLQFPRRTTTANLYFEDTIEARNTEYAYFIQALAAGKSPSLAGIEFSITRGVLIPEYAAVTSSAAIAGSDGSFDKRTVELRWDFPSDGAYDTNNINHVPADGYEVYTLSARNALERLVADVKADGSGIYSVVDSNGGAYLQPSADYKYIVRAYLVGSDGSYIYGKHDVTKAQTAQALPASSADNLQATVVNKAAIDVSWERVEGAASYKLVRSSGGVAKALNNKIGANVTVYSDKGLTPGVEYTYTLTPVANGKDGAAASVTQSIPALDSAGNLKVADSDAHFVKLEWEVPSDGAADIKGYGVFRITSKTAVAKPNTIKDSHLIATLDSSARAYSDGTVLPGTGYTYMVRPFAQGSDLTPIWGKDSAYLFVEVTKELPVPESSGVVAVAYTDKSMLLEWPAPDAQYTDVITGYNILRSDYNATKNSWSGYGKKGSTVVTAGADVFRFIDNSARQGVDYKYKIQPYYNNVVVEPDALPAVDAKIVQLPAVTSAGAVFSDGGMDAFGVYVSWNTYDWNSSGMPAGAKHGIDVFDKGKAVVLNGQTNLAESSGYFIPNLIPGNKYTYDLKPYFIGSDGNTKIYGVLAPTKEVNTAENAVVPAPSDANLEPKMNGTQVALSWTAPQGVSGLNGFKLYRGTTDSSAQATLLATKKLAELSHTDAKPNVGNYYYYVSAYRGAYESERVFIGSHGVPAPTSPTLESPVVTGNKEITLSWTPTLGDDGQPLDGAASYRIYRVDTSAKNTKNADGSWNWPATPHLTVPVVEGQRAYTWPDTKSTTPGKEYAYTVTAYNPNGGTLSEYKESAKSPDGKTAKLPAALKQPATLTVTSVEGPVVTLTWDPVDGADGYQIIRGGEIFTGSDGAFGSDGNGKLTYIDSDPDLQGKTGYIYAVRAYMDLDGEDPYFGPQRNATRHTTAAAFAKSVELPKDKYVLVNKTLKLTATVEPKGKTNGKLEWAVADDENGSPTALATIAQDGTLNAGSSSGTVFVKATASDGAAVSSGWVKVDIVGARVTIDQASVAAPVYGGQTRAIKAIYDGTAKGAEEWTVLSDGGLEAGAYTLNAKNGSLKVNAKKVTAPTTITVQLEATTKDKKTYTDSCAVLLLPEAASLRIYPSDGSVEPYAETGKAVQTRTIDLAAATSLQLNARVYDWENHWSADNPDTPQEVTWSASPKNIVDIDETGLVKLLKPGTVTIKATAKSNTKISASFRLQVYYVDATTRLTAKLYKDSSAAMLVGSFLEMGDKAHIAVFGANNELLDPSLFSYEIKNAKHKDFVEVLEGEPGGVKALFTDNGKGGSATVTVTLKGDYGKARSTTVAVKTEPVQIRDIVFNGSFVERGLLQPEYTSDATGALNVLNVDVNDKKYEFTVRPDKILDTDDEMVSPYPDLDYKSNNTGVATVKSNKDGSATITIKAKASGSVRITATAKDKAKAVGYFDLNVRDYTPRLGLTKFSINTALSDAFVTTELAESFGNTINRVSLSAYNKATKAYDLPADVPIDVDRSSDGVLKVIYTGEPGGTVKSTKLQLNVATRDGDFAFIITVDAKANTPKPTVKQGTEAFNYFYRSSSYAEFTVTVPNQTVTGVQLAADVTSDFEIVDSRATAVGGWEFRIRFKDAIRDDNAMHEAAYKKPSNRMKLQVSLEGYADTYDLTQTVKTSKTAPKIVTDPATATINTLSTLGRRSSSFQFFNQTAGGILDFEEADLNLDRLAGVTREQLAIDENSDLITATLTKDANTTITFQLQKDEWYAPVKVTHRINIINKAPTLSFSPASLTLNSAFRTAASTVGKLNQEGLNVLDISCEYSKASLRHLDANSNNFVAVAAKDAEAFANDAITFETNPNTGDITARYVSDGVLTGSVTYTFYFRVDGFDTPVKKDLSVKLENALPTVKFKTGTLRFNQKFLDYGETAESLLTLSKAGYSIIGVGEVEQDGYGAKNRTRHGASDGLVKFTLSHEADGVYLKAQLDQAYLKAGKHGNGDKGLQNGSYDYKLQLLLESDDGSTQQTITASFKVQIYSNDKAAATVKASGSLDVIGKRHGEKHHDKKGFEGNFIAYTLSGLQNVSGRVDDVSLAGPDADKFVISRFSTVDKNGKAVLGYVELGLKDGVEYETKKTYKVKFVFSIEGMPQAVETALQNVKVKQTAAKYDKVDSQNFFQSEVNPSRKYKVKLADKGNPEGIAIGRYELNTKSTPALLLQAMGIDPNDVKQAEKFIDDCIKNDEVTVQLKNPGVLSANKSYNLVLNVYAGGHAKDVSPVTVNIPIKIMK